MCVFSTDPDAVFTLLNKCHAHLTAYQKKSIPDRLHYRNNERIQPIILVADEGWTIVRRGNKLPRRNVLFLIHLSLLREKETIREPVYRISLVPCTITSIGHRSV